MHEKIHIHHWHYIKSDIASMYVNNALRTFAVSLIGIFIPIFLLKKGFFLNQIIIYFIVMFLSMGLFAIMAGILAEKFGLKHIIFISTPMSIIFFLILFYIDRIPSLLNLLAVYEGILSALYWIPFNSLFAKYSSKKRRGEQTGYLLSIPKLTAIAAPTIGGVIIVFSGYNALFIAIAILLAISVVPLFYSNDVKPHIKFSFEKILFKKNLKETFAFMFDGQRYVILTIIWPIFIYFLSTDILSLGLAGTATTLGAVIFPIVIGKLTKKISLKSILKIGGITSFVVWIYALFPRNISYILVLTLLMSIFSIMIELPFITIIFEKASRKHTTEYMVYRSICLNIGRVAILTILYVTLNKFIVGFSLTSLTSLFYIFF
ncbi:MFS transporter [Candidatus Woesearchaeota archaeon]|nr:MFS transporter [Candidatus Woesearchaeota archaeon]